MIAKSFAHHNNLNQDDIFKVVIFYSLLIKIIINSYYLINSKHQQNYHLSNSIFSCLIILLSFAIFSKTSSIYFLNFKSATTFRASKIN
jgi:hypothetical protein